MKIGILAVQGDFEAHAAMLARLDTESVEVRTPADLEGCDGLILPGGESTTQLQFLQEEIERWSSLVTRYGVTVD